VLLLLLLLKVDLGLFGDRTESGDSRKSKRRADNKRHTSAYQPLTSHSPIGATIPPSPPDFSFPTKNASILFRVIVPRAV
jgi:hypothetical protein